MDRVLWTNIAGRVVMQAWAQTTAYIFPYCHEKVRRLRLQGTEHAEGLESKSIAISPEKHLVREIIVRDLCLLGHRKG